MESAQEGLSDSEHWLNQDFSRLFSEVAQENASDEGREITEEVKDSSEESLKLSVQIEEEFPSICGI